MSVFGLVPTRDEPAECLPWTRRTGVGRYLLCLEMYVSAADSSWLMPQELKFVPSLEFQAGSRLYVTAAVKAASHFGRAQGDHSGQSKFKVHCDLLEP